MGMLNCTLIPFFQRFIFNDYYEDVNFLRNYSKSPTVLLAAKHSSGGGNAGAECNGIVSWIKVTIKVLMK